MGALDSRMSTVRVKRTPHTSIDFTRQKHTSGIAILPLLLFLLLLQHHAGGKDLIAKHMKRVRRVEAHGITVAVAEARYQLVDGIHNRSTLSRPIACGAQAKHPKTCLANHRRRRCSKKATPSSLHSTRMEDERRKKEAKAHYRTRVATFTLPARVAVLEPTPCPKQSQACFTAALNASCGGCCGPGRTSHSWSNFTYIKKTQPSHPIPSAETSSKQNLPKQTRYKPAPTNAGPEPGLASA